MHNFDNLDDISQSVLRSYTLTQNNAGKVGEMCPCKIWREMGGRLKKEVMRGTNHHNQQKHQRSEMVRLQFRRLACGKWTDIAVQPPPPTTLPFC
jgi:hypothetical protein